MPTHHLEASLETEICDHLAAHGWLYSPDDTGYDAELALFGEDVFGWLADTQPEQLSKRVKPELSGPTKAKAEHAVLTALAKTLDTDPKHNGGTLSVLRRGFKDLNAQFSMCQFRPNTTLTDGTKTRYEAVRLRVMRQVHYSTKNRNSIDLVFFVNGIPVSTAELKTDFTQNITDAVTQYKKDRNPKGEPLLSFGARAVVHFAVSNEEVRMTTKLAGADTDFLPFNRGNDTHAGNPDNLNGSPTAYLWETIFQRDTWLDILGRFMHLHVEDKVDPVTGKKTRKQSMLFPRFHQWEAVTSLVAAARTEGPGHKYLIQHSAGSGKTNSISWLAQRLSSLHDDADKPVFDSVIIITDRTVLDSQLKEAMQQIESTPGVIAHIDRLGGSKSKKLSEALLSGTKIIIVTIQTFPHALKVIENTEALKGKTFAVIADEAHSSQAGEASRQLKRVLTPGEIEDLEDGGSVSTEEVLAAEMEARASASNLSFFAFTATPKDKTLTLFGRIGDDGTPKPFHLYSMQQAIEEGFILDVLQNYTPYKTAFRLTHNGKTYRTSDSKDGGTVAVDGSDDDLVIRSKAVKSVMNWVQLHPTNISQKVQIIVEHFRQNVGWRLDGKAKAMVVTSSRRAAVRYKLAFDKYVKEHGYTDVSALVAFSGDVTDPESAIEKASETSEQLNPKLKGDIRTAFDTDEYNVMLVANKFQTGFDQPLLVAMYVDKKLSGVAAVQTLSRLNRKAPGKNATFVIDFTNPAGDIVKSFEPYYRATTLADVTDPNIVHQTMSKLDAYGMYTASDIDGLVEVERSSTGSNSTLRKWLGPAVEKLRSRERDAEAADDQAVLDEIDMFRKDVGTFLRQYDFLSQIINYEDLALEKLSIYLRRLAPLITKETLQHDVDLAGMKFEYLDHRKQDTVSPKLTGEEALKSMKGAGTGTVRPPEMVALDAVIEKINDLFADDTPTDSLGGVIAPAMGRLTRNATLLQQSASNSLAQFSASPDLHREFMDAFLDSHETAGDIVAQIVNKPETFQKVIEALVPVLYAELTKAAGK